MLENGLVHQFSYCHSLPKEDLVVRGGGDGLHVTGDLCVEILGVFGDRPFKFVFGPGALGNRRGGEEI